MATRASLELEDVDASVLRRMVRHAGVSPSRRITGWSLTRKSSPSNLDDRGCQVRR
jgi:hypothetical protein